MERVDVVVGLMKQDDRWLIARRPSGTSWGGFWEFPGGKVRPGEEERAALQREMEEELGIRVAVGLKRMVVEYAYPDRTVRLHCFDCRWVGGVLRPCMNQTIRWVAPEELDSFQFLPADRALIRALRRRS
jgi:8-oxo-dGTP diphosphatase